jgi:DNA-binding NtrC family response regulator
MSGKTITKQDVLDYAGPGGKTDGKMNYENFQNLQQFQDYMERSFLENKLDKNGWNVSKTAEAIGMPKIELEDKLENLGLKKR